MMKERTKNLRLVEILSKVVAELQHVRTNSHCVFEVVDTFRDYRTESEREIGQLPIQSLN